MQPIIKDIILSISDDVVSNLTQSFEKTYYGKMNYSSKNTILDSDNKLLKETIGFEIAFIHVITYFLAYSMSCSHEYMHILIFSGINPAIIGGKKENHYKYIAKNDRGTFYINTFKLNSRTQIRFRKARENHENSLHTINTLIDEILLKFQYNAELHDLKDLIYQLDNLRHLKQQELGKLPKDEMFEKAEEYLNDKGIENSLVFEEYNMDFKMKFNGSTYYCELLVDNSLEEKTEYRKNISVEKLTTWFEKLNSNFGILFYYPRINRMYFYPVPDTVSDILPD